MKKGFLERLDTPLEAEDMFDQILRLWAAEFGESEVTVKQLLLRASGPLFSMLRCVAPDRIDPAKVYNVDLGEWLGAHREMPSSGWVLRSRSMNRQNVWRLEPTRRQPPKLKTAEPVKPSPAARNLDTALDIDDQIMALGVDRDDPKTTRMVGEASGRTLSTAVRVDETSMRREDYRLANLDRPAVLLREKYDDMGVLLPKPKVIDNEPRR